MDLRQLRGLVTLADEGQFTRAADRLGIAQSSLSAQIRALEAELGLSLFDRTTRRVSLTDAGATLLTSARSVLAELDDVLAELARRRGLLSGRVTLGITPTPGPIDVVALLAEFHAAHPGVELSVREDLSVNLAAALRADEIDLGVLTITDAADRAGLRSHELARERLVAVLAPGHRHAGRSSLSLPELCADPLVLSPPGATIRATLLSRAAELGLEPRIAFASRDTLRLRSLVAAGLGVGLLPLSDAQAPGPAVAVVPLSDPEAIHVLSLGWREGRRHAPAARALMTRLGHRPDNDA